MEEKSLRNYPRPRRVLGAPPVRALKDQLRSRSSPGLRPGFAGLFRETALTFAHRESKHLQRLGMCEKMSVVCLWKHLASLCSKCFL